MESRNDANIGIPRNASGSLVQIFAGGGVGCGELRAFLSAAYAGVLSTDSSKIAANTGRIKIVPS